MASEKHTLQWLALLGFLNFVLALLFQTYYDHFLLLIFSHRLSLVLMCWCFSRFPSKLLSLLRLYLLPGLLVSESPNLFSFCILSLPPGGYPSLHVVHLCPWLIGGSTGELRRGAEAQLLSRTLGPYFIPADVTSSELSIFLLLCCSSVFCPPKTLNTKGSSFFLIAVPISMAHGGTTTPHVLLRTANFRFFSRTIYKSRSTLGVL